jgi:hypothetical protein
MAVPITNGDASFGPSSSACGTIFGWVFITSFIVWLLIKLIMGLDPRQRGPTCGRLKNEYEGVDVGECGTARRGLLVRSSYTGKIGDGKIFVTPLEQVIRIRTRETGAEAL